MVSVLGMDKLDEIWDSANPCKCGNDDKWAQDIFGGIHCTLCKQEVAENVIKY